MNPFLRGATPPAPVLNIGHRGCAALPENTLAAFSAGLAAGAHAVECDLQTTRDGVIVVIHDDTVTRTTDAACRLPGREKVAELTLAEIKSLDPGTGAGTIPTLQETLDLVRARGARINLEAKSADPDRVVRIVRDCGMTERVILSNFDLDWVARARSLAADIAVSALVEKPGPGFIRSAVDRLKVDLIAPGKDVASPALVAEARKAGLGVHVWTVNDPAEMKALIRSGVTGLFTDHPERLTRVLAGV